jgi:transposase
MLMQLVRMSASPLADIEHDFAIDSSGFRTTTYSSWHEEKHGKSKQNIWLKAHISTGVATNIVADVRVTRGHSADINEFESLLIGTSGTFRVKEVSADKGYLSRDNYALVKSMGADAYIMFKENSRGRSHRSSAWMKAFYHFQNNKEDFLNHYHKRSNVETTFMAIKQKFGETLKSKNTTAQVNELFCKIIAYNITVLINAMYTRNIDVKFPDVSKESVIV